MWLKTLKAKYVFIRNSPQSVTDEWKFWMFLTASLSRDFDRVTDEKKRTKRWLASNVLAFDLAQTLQRQVGFSDRFNTIITPCITMPLKRIIIQLIGDFSRDEDVQDFVSVI